MPTSSEDQAIIESFDALVRQIQTANRDLSRRACVGRAAARNPKLHRQYIIATNPDNRRAAVDLADWRRDVRSQWNRAR